MVGLLSYGAYIPRLRLTAEEIGQVWGKDVSSIKSALGVLEKSVAGADEDAVTLGFEASFDALSKTMISPEKIGAIFVGSESHPYAVNPTSTIIGEFLGAGHEYFSSDLEFACKAATTGMVFSASLLKEKKIDYSLVVGTDCAQAKPHDILEYTAASGAAAFILGRKKEEVIAEVIDYTSYSSDTPDFWRRDGVSYPSHSGRFTGEPSYFTHVMSASKKLLSENKMKPSNFDFCVFHMPNGKFPKQVGKRLGFLQNQFKLPLAVEKIGNPYSASALLGLVDVLESARENQYIFFCSYGSGAGADAFIFKTTKNINKFAKNRKTLNDLMEDKKHISYTSYLKARGVI